MYTIRLTYPEDAEKQPGQEFAGEALETKGILQGFAFQQERVHRFGHRIV